MKRMSCAVGALAAGLIPLAMATSASAATAESHCWMDLSSGQTRCFSSFQRVVDAVSGGRVTVSKGATSLSEAQRAKIAATAAAPYVLGTWFQDANYGGSSYLVTGNTDCDTNADVDYQIGTMPPGWNDQISSFKSYGLCATRIWENTFSGASYGFYVNSSYVGDAMNDRASSIQWN